MAVFAYRALDPRGSVQTGTLTADTPADGRRRLRENGLFVEEFSPASRSHRGRANGGRVALQWVDRLRSSRRADQVAEFARHLALLLRSGVPLAEAMDVLIDQCEGGAWQATLRELRDRVSAGRSLAEALSDFADWFDELFISAVRVGEQAGTLDTALAELAAFLKERHTLRNRLTSAMIYPLILAGLGLGVTLFLMTYVIPQLLTVLESSGKPLPTSTAVLKRFSDLLINQWPWITLSCLIAASLCCAAWRRDQIRKAVQRLNLRLPLLGTLLRKTLVARFSQQMSMLLGSGIPFTEAISIVRRGCRNLVLNDELRRMEEAVRAGSDVAPAMTQSAVFPPLVVHLVAVGQNTGELTEMLDQLRIGYETEVNLAVGRFTSALEPLLIVVLAGVIGFIIFATMMPILELTRAMQ